MLGCSVADLDGACVAANDLPAAFLLETVGQVFQTFDLARGEFTVRGEKDRHGGDPARSDQHARARGDPRHILTVENLREPMNPSPQRVTNATQASLAGGTTRSRNDST